MNKSELIEALASRFEGNKKAARHALDSVLETVTREVARGEKVAIAGFGAFEKVIGPARKLRSSHTGKDAPAQPTAVPTFKAGSELKAAVAETTPPPAAEPTSVEEPRPAGLREPKPSTERAKVPRTGGTPKPKSRSSASGTASPKKPASASGTVPRKPASASRAASSKPASKKPAPRKPRTTATSKSRTGPAEPTEPTDLTEATGATAVPTTGDSEQTLPGTDTAAG